MKYKVTVFLKDNVFDPQGNSILRVLHNLGYKGIQNVRVGKVFIVESDNNEEMIKKVANEVFCNNVIEKFEVERMGE